MTPNEESALRELEWEISAPHTLEEIAQWLGYTQRGVELIEARALKKLRRLLRRTDWSEGLDEPETLHRRCGDVFSGDGSAPKREVKT